MRAIADCGYEYEENKGTLKGFAIYWESEPVCREFMALSPMIHTPQGTYTGVFHLILELSVHGNFECIDNQLLDKTGAHFESFKLPKCALEF